MSVVSEVSGRAGVRRTVPVELGAIAVMWLLLFAAAYALASGSSTHAALAPSPLATGSRVDASAVLGSEGSQVKQPTLVGLPSVPPAPALRFVPPKPKPHPTVVVSRPPVVSVTPTQSAPVVQQPVTVTPSGGGTERSSSGSGSHSSGSSSQTGTGTVSGGG